MTDTIETATMTAAVTKPEAAPTRGRRTLIALVAGAAIVTAGAFGAHAIAQSKPFQHMQMAAFDGGGMMGGGFMGGGMMGPDGPGGGWQGGWRHHDRMPLAEMSPAEVERRVTRMVRHMAIEIDATPEQETKIVAVVTGAVKELLPMRDQMRGTGQELQQLLTADSIDRAALEALRTSRLAEADKFSKTLVDAVANVAEVLTPEQRGMLQEMIRRHHGGGRRGG